MLVQHGVLPSLAGAAMMGGPYLTGPSALAGAAQLRADGNSSCCFTVNLQNLGCPRNKQKKIRFEQKQIETRSVSVCFVKQKQKFWFVSVSFGVSNLY